MSKTETLPHVQARHSHYVRRHVVSTALSLVAAAGIAKLSADFVSRPRVNQNNPGSKDKTRGKDAHSLIVDSVTSAAFAVSAFIIHEWEGDNNVSRRSGELLLPNRKAQLKPGSTTSEERRKWNDEWNRKMDHDIK